MKRVSAVALILTSSIVAAEGSIMRRAPSRGVAVYAAPLPLSHDQRWRSEIDGLGCGELALESAKQRARELEGDAIFVECVSRRGRGRSVERFPSTDPSSSLRYTIVRRGTVWWRPAN